MIGIERMGVYAVTFETVYVSHDIQVIEVEEFVREKNTSAIAHWSQTGPYLRRVDEPTITRTP